MIFGVFDKKSLPLVALFLVGLIFLPYAVPRFYIYLTSVILVTGLLATSLNLVLGYGGMYQFHHAVFYGIGAYTTALMLTKTSLPVWFAFASAPVVAAFFGLVIGLICARLSSLHFGMLQISLGSLIWAIVYRWYDFTGGDDGIHGIPVSEAISTTTSAYYFILVITALCLLLMFVIIRSPFGRILQALRDNPERCEAIGVNITRHRIIAMVIAALFAGAAGSLFVTLEGSVFPELLSWTLSLEILIMCLLGGWFTFFGPMLGACLIISLRTFAGNYTEYWTLILGLMMMLTIFFLPKGVFGFINELFRSGSPSQPLEEGSNAAD
ncbi:MAG: branched-chain amino acid ABC transporter permease [Desulfuromonadales bacterium]|nr:branched-chain amino acid ABC transporter permease [Desulfuromonadales bacterium]